jgi:hypothetical protein
MPARASKRQLVLLRAPAGRNPFFVSMVILGGDTSDPSLSSARYDRAFSGPGDEQPLVQLRRDAKMGVGMFALKHFKRGDVIFTERADAVVQVIFR